MYDSDNNNIAVPIISPMLSPRIVPKSPSILSSDSDSDVSVSSSDDTSESDSDAGDHPFSPNSLQKQLLKDLSNVQISTIEKSTISNEDLPTTKKTNENNSDLPTPKNKKKIKRTPTTGRGLVRPTTSSVNGNTSASVHKGDANKSTKPYDTDDENRPLRLVRPRSNSRAQEQKGLNEIFLQM